MRGVYVITAPSGNQYVGSSCNVRRRWAEHRNHLRKGAHTNAALQRAFNKYGEALRFQAFLSVLDEGALAEMEQAVINQMEPEYNALNPHSSTAQQIRESERHARARLENQKRAAEAISRPVVRLTDGAEFPSCYAAAEALGAATPDNIFTAIRCGWRFMGHFFAYAEDAVSLEELEYRAEKREAVRKRRATKGMIRSTAKPVVRLSDGKRYPTVAAARRENRGGIDRALKNGTMAGGSRWAYAGVPS